MFVNLSLVGQRSLHAYRSVTLSCRVEFNIGHSGKNDVGQHVQSQKHIRAAEAQKGTQAISNYITKGQTEQEQMLQDELKMAMLVTKTTSRSIQPDSGAL